MASFHLLLSLSRQQRDCTEMESLREGWRTLRQMDVRQFMHQTASLGPSKLPISPPRLPPALSHWNCGAHHLEIFHARHRPRITHHSCLISSMEPCPQRHSVYQVLNDASTSVHCGVLFFLNVGKAPIPPPQRLLSSKLAVKTLQ